MADVTKYHMTISLFNYIFNHMTIPGFNFNQIQPRISGFVYRIHAKMPKVLNNTLPLSGLFAIVKPSGPTSMAILDRLKPLFARSRLLVDQEEYKKILAERERQKKHKRKPKQGRMSRPSDRPKLGQGGTLDPLADGVLGESESAKPLKTS
jgi:hypothetical protein